MRREAQGRRHMHRADELLRAAEKHLREARPDIIRVTPAGDFRRGCELAGDLSLVAEVRKLPNGPQTITAGGQLTAHLTDAAHYGITLLLATGSDAHLAALRALAAERNMILDEKGLRRGGKLVAAASEDSIYKALRMQPVPPELREGRDEVPRALAGTLPELVTDADIAGILHAHTDRSDGVDTLETMAEATLSRGYQYFGVADHSKSAHYAGGLSQEEVAEQQAEADALNRKYGKSFRIFKGIESDILADGSLDYPDDGAGDVRLCRRERARPFQDGPRSADRAHHPRGVQSLYHHPRAYDRAAIAAPPRLRHRHREGARGLRRARRRRRNQRQPVAARS